MKCGSFKSGASIYIDENYHLQKRRLELESLSSLIIPDCFKTAVLAESSRGRSLLLRHKELDRPSKLSTVSNFLVSIIF